MNEDSFVYDTYAIIEIIRGNENYKDYLNKKIIINSFIFAEICYVLIRNKYPELDNYLERYKKYIVSINPGIIKKAMEFRYVHKNKKMSMVNCVSYFLAKELNIRFLTGDKEFENLENVEFVK